MEEAEVGRDFYRLILPSCDGRYYIARAVDQESFSIEGEIALIQRNDPEPYPTTPADPHLLTGEVWGWRSWEVLRILARKTLEEYSRKEVKAAAQQAYSGSNSTGDPGTYFAAADYDKKHLPGGEVYAYAQEVGILPSILEGDNLLAVLDIAASEEDREREAFVLLSLLAPETRAIPSPALSGWKGRTLMDLQSYLGGSEGRTARGAAIRRVLYSYTARQSPRVPPRGAS